MKKYLLVKKRILPLLLCGFVGMSFLATPNVSFADDTAEKIRLMADALRARDSGDLDRAQQNAEELVRRSPDNENAQRLLASINAEIERRGGGEAPVFGQVTDADVEEAVARETSRAVVSDDVSTAVVDEQEAAIAAGRAAAKEARQLADLGAFTDANNVIASARGDLEFNLATASTIEKLDSAAAYVLLQNATALAADGDSAAAETLLREFREAGGDRGQSARVTRAIHQEARDPANQDIADTSPGYVENQRIVSELIGRGRAQFLNGDYEGAVRTFLEIEARDPDNAEAKLFQQRIAAIIGDVHSANRYKTREQMLAEVDQSWERPKVFSPDRRMGPDEREESPILRKLNEIRIPRVNFQGMELTRVIETLSELSVDFDETGEGINIIPLFDSDTNNPRVNINVRNLTLDEILQFVTQQVNFVYDVGRNAITVTATDARGGRADLITEFFPISRATVIRLTGVRDAGGDTGGPVNPFDPAPTQATGGDSSEELENLRRFFVSAGVNFDVPGSSLAFDGEQLIVTQTTRNLERMRTILRRYDETRQVEIEAKFLEVVQGDLEELGFDWMVGAGRTAAFDSSGLPILGPDGQQQVSYNRQFNTSARTAQGAFGVDQEQSAINITGTDPVAFNAPQIPNLLDLGENVGNLFSATGWSVNGYDVNFAIRALARKTGSDLMSAPRVTVLSGKRANITVAQELRYPESYGDIDSQVSQSSGSSSLTGGGTPAVSVTAGTPRDFTVRNVGVEMSVTPNVETNDTISLLLEPRVTEFEGFVEYGGPSVAIAGGTTVTVPAGFFQPVFSTRAISTEVTVFDGATIVMGGLTRDEVKTYSDRVPVLGNIPAVGRLFRSEGETSQKRNLLIFVTANLISPGGSPARQQYRTVEPNSLFQNPTIMTPSGAANRRITVDAEAE